MADQITYISDRSDQYEVSSMETSHLVNVIGHHVAQIKTLQTLPYHPQSRARMEMLQQVIHILTEELVQRKVDIVEYIVTTEAET